MNSNNDKKNDKFFPTYGWGSTLSEASKTVHKMIKEKIFGKDLF